MSSLDSFPPEILEMIIGRLSHDGQVSLSKVSHHFNNLLPRFELETLKLCQLSNSIMISSFSLDRPMVQQFFALHNHSLRTWRIKGADKQKVNGYRKFSFPPTAKFSFFGAAKIDHLEIHKQVPVYLDNDNIDHLTSLLSGCIVNKITLVIDKQTLEKVDKLPALFASIQAKHVEFVLEKTKYYEMHAPFANCSFALDLVKAGVKEVTFSGKDIGRAQNVVPEHHDINKPSLAFDVLLNLIGAGIESVNVNGGSLENTKRIINRKELDEFIAELTGFEHSSRLSLKLRGVSYEILNPLGKDRKFVCEKGGSVNVVRMDSSVECPYLLNIEVRGKQSTI